MNLIVPYADCIVRNPAKGFAHALQRTGFRLLEQNGFRLIKEKGSIRYYAKAGHPNLVRVDFHGSKEVPTGTCHAILKAAGLKGR